MKKVLCFALMLPFFCAVLAFADDGDKSDKKDAAKPTDRREEFRQRMQEAVKKYDKDKDGKLNENERRAMFEAMRERMKEARGGDDRRPSASPSDRQRGPQARPEGRPQPRPEGRPGGPDQRLQGIMAKHDKDGDKKLNENELKAMFGAIHARMAEHMKHRDGDRRGGHGHWGHHRGHDQRASGHDRGHGHHGDARGHHRGSHDRDHGNHGRGDHRGHGDRGHHGHHGRDHRGHDHHKHGHHDHKKDDHKKDGHKDGEKGKDKHDKKDSRPDA